jgi:DNA-binding response OmpR family regulator
MTTPVPARTRSLIVRANDALPREQSLSQHVGAPSEWRLEHPTVLIIDDDEDTRDLVGAILEQHGLAVIKAGTGAAGLTAAEENDVAAVVLDVVMPGLDGHEVLRQLREGALHSDIPVIMLTGLDALDSELESVLSGANAYLIKPVRRDELLRRLDDLLCSGFW